MKNHLGIWCAFVTALSLVFSSGCGPVKNKQEIIVFAAASLTEPLNEIKEKYEADHKNTEIVYNFDSSGTLKTQITEGAACDIFISASPKQMNDLEDNALLDVNTRIDLLENKVVLAVTTDNPAGVRSFCDMKDRVLSGDLLLALGNSDVPAGQYAIKIFNFFGIDENTLSSLTSVTYGSNVKEVTAFVTEGSADCGIIYATDAFSAGLTAVDSATEEMCGKVIYPAAVLNHSGHAGGASLFLDYLTGDIASETFAKIGFTPLGK